MGNMGNLKFLKSALVIGVVCLFVGQVNSDDENSNSIDGNNDLVITYRQKLLLDQVNIYLFFCIFFIKNCDN